MPLPKTTGASRRLIASLLVLGLYACDSQSPREAPKGGEGGKASFSVADAQITEGDSGTQVLTFTVTRGGADNPAVSVRVATADGTADSGDYTAVPPTTLTFERGVTSRTVDVTINGDTDIEADENFFLDLSEPSANAEIADGQAIGTILNDDEAPPPPPCTPDSLCVGAAKRVVTPSQQHIDGVTETRFGAPKVQKFNLGGFGINPLQNFPDPFGGFGENLTEPAQERVFEGSRGPEHTFVRAMAVQQLGDPGELVVFVMLDAVGAGNVIQDGLKQAVVAAAAAQGFTLKPENILFGQTHTHAGADLQGLWGGVPQDWIVNTLYPAAAEAVAEALATRRSARLTVQQGQNLAFNNYRRPRVDPLAEADGTLTLLTATALDGSAIGSILQYNAHPTSINEDPRIPHADYIQGAMDWLEDPATGAGGVALYYNGPIADASGSGGRAGCTPAEQDGDYGNVRCRGEGMADAAQDFAPRELAPTLTARSVEVILPVTNPAFVVAGALGSFNRYYDFTELPADQIPGIGEQVAAGLVDLPQLTPTARTLVSRITIGGAEQGLEIVTLPGEATNTFGQYIRGLAATDVMLLGLTQQSFGYIIPEEEFSYIDPSGDAGFLLPFTGYEEFVSLGPLTAPLLRLQGYNVLFEAAPEQNIPDYIRACEDPMSPQCVLVDVGQKLDYIQRSYARTCRENDGPEQFCALLDPATPLRPLCDAQGFPEGVCSVFGPPPPAPPSDAALAPLAADAALRGCDILDPAHCLFPFPSDHFTVAAPAGSPQHAASGGTGKRINLNVAAMPRNTAGKPIDPTEWNRNDGYSPGQMIVTYVPGLAANADGTIPGAVPLTDLNQYDDANAPVLVLDAGTGERHPIWAEIDLTAGTLLYVPGGEFDSADQVVPRPGPVQAPLLVRPAVNFKEGHRYVVVLRNLPAQGGGAVPAQAAFRACATPGFESSLPPVASRCAHLRQHVFPVLEAAGIARDASLYLAWDFTVASSNNTIGRLRHMRDDAFVNYLGQQEDATGAILDLGRAPAFEITEVNDFPPTHGQLVREIKGTFTVPSYVVPVDPSPADGQAELRRRINEFPPEIQEQIESGELFAPIEASLPPNRLFYNPADGLNPADPQGSRFGDGLPDRSGELTTTFTCRIARSTLSNKSFAEASAADVRPARASLYGHGLLGDHGEINQDQLRRLGNDHNMMFCATDWFGFASGDLPNVVSLTLDVSNFPVLPDATQQGILNQMFLARLMRHPQGFAGNAAFRVGGVPVFDTREVFYDGNSQGGITGGVVVAVSKDIRRGALGVLGMNYSTLLTRSVDFDLFSVPLYASYTSELDRNFIFSLMQMLWDRSENNGYAHHLRDNAALKGPVKEVLLHPAYGDHQVTMWSADVMARTVGGHVDRSRVSAERRAAAGFDKPELGMQTLDYANPEHGAGSGLVYWDEPWPEADGDDCAGDSTPPPPIGNVPPRSGVDPHECPRRQVAARCQKSHFLHSQGRLIDVGGVVSPLDCPLEPDAGPAPGASAAAPAPDYGKGVFGAMAQFVAELNAVITALLSGDGDGALAATQAALNNLGGNLAALPDAAGDEGTVLGLDRSPADYVARAGSANREAEAVVLTGASFPDWSAPAATGLPYPYPSGAAITGEIFDQDPSGLAPPGRVRDAHNGRLLYPSASRPATPGAPIGEIAAYAFRGGAWVEIPVQVDERMPYFLANANSNFSVYSGTDPELTYVWDTESWGMTAGLCEKAYDTNGLHDGGNEGVSGATPDPVPGLDNDDEIVFMAADAGDFATPDNRPADVPAGAPGQQIALADPLDPSAQRFVYLFRKPGGSRFAGQSVYVSYQRHADADQWIDRSFFADDDPEKLGTSNTGYGPNLSGTVCKNGLPLPSSDRFPRDGVTVTTDRYRWQASGRWMVRDIRIAPARDADDDGRNDPYDWSAAGAADARYDLVDRWKGRAFQQSPDSSISLVGFEDEQVNWEANSSLLGERRGPVRAIREVWGADSGTNVTKTETFYRDAVSYRYHVRVHPIPPDGLYTSWDYNRGAMVSSDPAVPGGRYFTALRPQGVPVDGINDEVGNIDGFAPFPGLGCPSPDDAQDGEPFVPPNEFGRCPAFFDSADPSFNLPLAFDNWEQVSGKGDSGSLVYTFQIGGLTSLASPLVVPYYRDDACLDDGTGDDPVQRPYPGERSDDPRVIAGYSAAAGKPYEQLACHEKQGAYASHGVHYFFTGDTDNLFAPLVSSEIDGIQWQFMVPTAQPQNVAEPYANIVRAPLQAVVVPLPPAEAPATEGRSGGIAGLLTAFVEDLTGFFGGLADVNVTAALDEAQRMLGALVGNLRGVLYEDGGGSVTGALHNAAAADEPAADTGSDFLDDLVDVVLGPQSATGLMVGVGVVDMTPDVGYCAGQYCDAGSATVGVIVRGVEDEDPGAIADVPGAAEDDLTGEADPFGSAKVKKKSHGVQSRLTARAIVVQGSNGKRIALLKTDNYLAQDNLLRRVGQILEQGDSGIGHEQILHHVTHNHSSAYSATLSWGVWVFQDIYDARFFENQARKIAQAIEQAAATLRPAKMGATQVRHTLYKGNVVRLATADDGTPAGYPLEYGDHGLVVMRFDTLEGAPIAVWANFGEHPESLDGYDLHSADFLGPLERFVDRELRVPLVFSQGDVGSAENTGNASQRVADDGSVCGTRADASGCPAGQGVVRDWNHRGYVQTERNVRFLADDIIEAFHAIGEGDAVVPFTTEVPVDYVNGWVPGPLSHPYPSVSNCRMEPTVGGDTGAPILGLPDCERTGFPGDNPVHAQAQLIYNTLKVEGVPVPEHYDAASFTGVQENLRIRLQAMRLGEVLLASCACEAQVDLILNLESRTDAIENNIYDGFDWACLLPAHAGEAVCQQQKQYYDPAEFPTAIPGGNFAPAAIAHMRAQVHNDAAGWDAPDYLPFANAEPADPAAIKGNFTKEEIQDLGAPGYKLAVGIGHAADYNGYVVSYREYMNRDHYRKALTAWGPHTADYMVTRLTRMAAQMQGAPDLVPEAHDAAAQADEARQEALARLHGQATAAAYETWHAMLPNDVGPPRPLAAPNNVERFGVSHFSWIGGSTAVDNPVVSVERCTRYPSPCVLDGEWEVFADQTGEVPVRVAWPEGIPGVMETYAGQFEWRWTAAFEAYSAFPARLGSTPEGQYRFKVRGRARALFETVDYGFRSAPFLVTPYAGLAIDQVVRDGETVSFQVPPVRYPRTYGGSPFPYVVPTDFDVDPDPRDIRLNDNGAYCERCAFRPWAQRGAFARAELQLAGEATARPAACALSGETAFCTVSGVPAGVAGQIVIFDTDGNVGAAAIP